jgi:SAM-dependent methyltransferase
LVPPRDVEALASAIVATAKRPATKLPARFDGADHVFNGADHVFNMLTEYEQVLATTPRGKSMQATDKSHFTLSAAQYEQARRGHLDDRRRDLVMTALAARADHVRTVIEIGFGSGRLLAECAVRFPHIIFRGVEVDPKMVAYAREHYRAPNLSYDLVDVTTQPPALHCEFVYSIDVIHHIHEPLAFFRAVRGLLATDGTWLAIEPNIFHPYILYQQERMRRRGLDEDHFRPWRLLPLLRQAGFEVTKRRFAFVFPGSIRRLPRQLARLERCVENCRFLGGSVTYLLSATEAIASDTDRQGRVRLAG